MRYPCINGELQGPERVEHAEDLACEENGHAPVVTQRRRRRRRPPEFVAALDRGLRVLLAFGPERPRLTLSEVAKVAGVTPATARRALLTLHALGFVRCASRRTFSLSPEVLRLSAGYRRLIENESTANGHTT